MAIAPDRTFSDRVATHLSSSYRASNQIEGFDDRLPRSRSHLAKPPGLAANLIDVSHEVTNAIVSTIASKARPINTMIGAKLVRA